ncbi:MAG TPA: hypothetical protein PKE21_15005 [Flavobacteriales bacterium]|nr:hypothetical protein [Flavobacteriales bacterium]HMR28788.1 hypothetical protein [Flavobacteriales bacterium]
MAAVLTIALLLVLVIYSRSVWSVTRHAWSELMRYLTLVLGLLFVMALLVLLYVLS